MRIGIFTDTYKPDANGVAQSVEVLSNNLINLGHEVFIFCPGSNLLVERIDNIIYIPGIEVKKLYGYKIAQPIHPLLLNEIEKLNLDIIHGETEFGVGTLANFVSHLYNIPLVRTYHTDYVDYTHYFVSEDLGPIYKGAKSLVSLYAKTFGDNCLKLMTPSLKTKEGLIKEGIKTDICVIPNGIELYRFSSEAVDIDKSLEIRKDLRVQDDEKLLIYVGRIAEEKRVSFLIEVMRKAISLGLKYKLLIVGLGTAYEKNLKLVNEYELNDYIKFTGKVEPQDVPVYYHAADFFISASTSETQGLTYIEALASSLPIIVAYDTVLDELVKDGLNGFFFNNENECLEVLKKLNYLQATEISELKQNALKSADVYNALKFAKDTLKLYEEVIEEFKVSYKIIKTTFVNDIVKLSLENKIGETIKLSLTVDDYVLQGFRKDSLVSKAIVDSLKEKEKLALAYRSALRKLSMKDYSSKSLYDSLQKKFSLSDLEAIQIINKLKELNLINDEKYTISRISILKESLLSKKAIFSKLVKEGISKDLIDRLYIDDQDDILKARKKALKYQDSIKGKSINNKKQSILVKLINDGFAIDDAKTVVGELDFSKEMLKETDLLKAEAQKAYNKYSNKYEGYELRNHIFNSLASKGFSLESIYAVINEMEY